MKTAMRQIEIFMMPALKLYEEGIRVYYRYSVREDLINQASNNCSYYMPKILKSFLEEEGQIESSSSEDMVQGAVHMRLIVEEDKEKLMLVLDSEDDRFDNLGKSREEYFFIKKIVDAMKEKILTIN